MTLIELLVGLTFAGIVGTTGYAIYTTSIDTRERTNRLMEPVSNAAAARTLLAQWIGSAHTTGEEHGVEFIGSDVSLENSIDRLSFLTSDARPLVNGPATLLITLDNDTATRERGLVASITSGAEEKARMSLLPEANALHLEYFGEIDGVSQWWPSWRSAVRLPAAVRVTIGTADSIRTVATIPIVVLLAPTQ